MINKNLIFAIVFAIVAVPLLVAIPATATNACGSGTDITRAGATNENAPVYARIYTINSGVTVTTSTQPGIVICASQEIIINGTLSVQNRGGAGGAAGGSSGAGGLGSGGSGGSGCGLGGQNLGGAATTATISTISRFLVGWHDGTSNLFIGAGGGGPTAFATLACPGGGGGGGYLPGGNSGVSPTISIGTAGTATAGGNGAGWILLISPKITIASTGTITAAGTNAANVAVVPSNAGGGGGGGGGAILLQTNDLVNNGILTVNGGNGGNGGGVGATGGAGATLTTNPGNGIAASSGGTGGGGGAAGSLQIREFGGSVFASLIKQTVESAGANCANGGMKVDSGLDNGDGGGTANNEVLESGEIDATAYVCNGADGATGPEGPEGPEGPQGPAGPMGPEGDGNVTNLTVESEFLEGITVLMPFIILILLVIWAEGSRELLVYIAAVAMGALMMLSLWSELEGLRLIMTAIIILVAYRGFVAAKEEMERNENAS